MTGVGASASQGQYSLLPRATGGESRICEGPAFSYPQHLSEQASNKTAVCDDFCCAIMSGRTRNAAARMAASPAHI